MRRLLTASLLASGGTPAALEAQGTTETGALGIVDFRPETRTIGVGDSAWSEVRVRNATARSRRVWIGYSLQDPRGEWFDVAPVTVEIEPGVTIIRRLAWSVPRDPLPAVGAYRVVMAVWSGPPGADDSRRLSNADRREAFRVRRDGAPLVDEPGGLWHAGDHLLGRGRLRPENVLTAGNGFRLRLPGGSCDGAELRGNGHVHFGIYAARLRTPTAPGSLSAFFFYGSSRGANDEIDIEIFNDGSRNAILTAWIDGRRSRTADVVLPFDPSDAMHDYEIRWSAKDLAFAADGVVLASWTSGYPRDPMRLMANVWWPTWLPCSHAATDRELVIERLLLKPVSSVR